MQLTHSVQSATASCLAFYVPAVVIMCFTDFEAATHEALAATGIIRDALRCKDEDHPFDAARAVSWKSALAGRAGGPVARRISECCAASLFSESSEDVGRHPGAV